MKKHVNWWKIAAVFICAAFLLGGMGAIVTHGNAMQAKKNVEHQKAFALYANKCLGCHDSVADPEKPGRTRDDWHLVVNVMHKYGIDITAEEADIIIDLLYDLRQGMEREAG